jgi:hypothetical protein
MFLSTLPQNWQNKALPTPTLPSYTKEQKWNVKIQVKN